MAEMVVVQRPALMWPETLPGAAFVEGYSGAEPSRGLESTVDAGPSRVRALPWIPRRSYTVQYFLDEAELETLEAFAASCTGRFFLWPHPRGRHELLVACIKAKGKDRIFEHAAVSGVQFSCSVTFETQQNVSFNYDGVWPWQ